MSDLERNQLAKLIDLTEAKEKGDGWIGECPAHEDSSPSFSFKIGDNRRLICTCFAGCSFESIKAACESKGVWPKGKTSERKEDYRKKLTAEYFYHDADGNVLYRIDKKQNKLGRKSFFCYWNGKWKHPPLKQRILFQLPKVIEAVKKQKTICLCEGEKDALNVEKLGFTATAHSAGTNNWSSHYTEPLRGAKRVAVLIDNDSPGRAWGRKACTDLSKIGVPSYIVPTATKEPADDVSNWIENGGTAEQLKALIDMAPLFKAEEKKKLPTFPRNIYPFSDMGNLERLKFYYKDKIRFSEELGAISYNGKNWVFRDKVGVGGFISDTLSKIQDEKYDETNSAVSKKISEWWKSSNSTKVANSLLTKVKMCPDFAVKPDQFNQDDFALNCQNGELNLKTGELQPHKAESYHSLITGTEFNPEAESPLWQKFVSEIMSDDEEMIAYTQRLAGYILCGRRDEQAFAFAFGDGANGKSLFIETLSEMLGSYAKSVSIQAFVKKRDGAPTNEIAALKDVRFIVVPETTQGDRFDEAQIKAFTGGDVISCRFLFKEPFEFIGKGFLFIRGNHKPIIKGDDLGIWRRLQLIPFLAEFAKLSDLAKRKEKNPDVKLADLELKSKLRKELPGILNWAIEGFRQWQEMGLQPPEIVINAVEDYKSENDLLGNYIEERLVVSPELQGLDGVLSNEVYKDYKDWCEQEGVKFQLTSKGLSMRLFNRLKQGGVAHGKISGHRAFLNMKLRFQDDNISFS